MVAAELLAGARDKIEQKQIESFLSGFNIHSPNEKDALAALELYKQHHLSHGVDWPDCQIAATALRLGLEVYTQNVKHFAAFSGLAVMRAY
jgi:predicted nucleic acid-binding protein